MSSRTLASILVVLLVGSGLFILPTTGAQGTGLTIPDAANDVVFTPQGLGAGEPLPQPFPGGTEQVIGIADLTEVRISDETPTALTFAYKVQNFERANTAVPTGAIHRICFTYSGTGATYQFVLNYFYGQTSTEPAVLPTLTEVRLERLGGACDPFHLEDAQPFLDDTHYTVTPDFEANEVVIQMQREKFALLSGDAKSPDPMPVADDQLSDVQGFATGAIGANQVFYDETTTDVFTFATDTANRLVRVVVPENLAGAFGVKSRGVPIYGVEVNSFQIVPLTLENHLDTPIQPQVSVQIIEGDAALWDVRSVPPIPVGKKTGEEPGRETVSLVVNTKDGVQHKERMRLLVTAIDAAHPQHLGGAVVDIVAVQPPVGGANKLYFHGTGDPCNSERRWMNTLQSDPSGTAASIDFHNCQGNVLTGQIMTAGDAGRVFFPDVPFGRNYELSTTLAAEASVVMKSVVRIPGQQPVDLPVPTPAELVVQLFAGQKILGEGKLSVEIPPEDTRFTVPVDIVGQTLTALTQEVQAETPINVRVAVIPNTRTFEYCAEDPCGFQGEVEVPSANGMVHMQMGGESWITLPIAASERAGEIVNITESGALISLRLSEGENSRFTNPGRIVVFNLTVRNEGVNVDTARLSAQVNRTGWTVEILPATEYQLKVGQPRAFNLKVTAPADARESDRVRIDVYATSTVDPDASARLPLFIQATTQQQFTDQELDPNLQKLDKEKESPGAAFVPLTLALLGLAFMMRRRKD